MTLKKNPGYEEISKIRHLEEELAKTIDLLGLSDKSSKEVIKENPDISKISEKLDIWKKEMEQENFPLKAYESICINGAVLVDGNYLYLESLRAMSDFILNGNLKSPKFGEHMKLFKFSADDEKNILNTIAKNSEALSKSLSSIANHLFMLNTGQIYKKIIKNVYEIEKDVYSREELISLINGSSRPKSSNTLFYDWSLDVNFFDALLPDNKDAISYVEKISQRFNGNKNTENVLRELNLGIWKSYHEGKNTEVPYDLKNKYIEKIKTEMKGDLILGRKKLNLHNLTGHVYASEKEVDTNLTIKGAELANRSDLDFILLVTNDGDFRPLIKYMKEKKKKVFLYSPGDPKRVSKHLINTIGKNNCIARSDVMGAFKEAFPFWEKLQPSESTDFSILSFSSLILDNESLEKIFRNHKEDFVSKDNKI